MAVAGWVGGVAAIADGSGVLVDGSVAVDAEIVAAGA
jgi:hypothetical protein